MGTPAQTVPVAPGKQQYSPGPLGWSAVALSLWSVTSALVTVMSMTVVAESSSEKRRNGMKMSPEMDPAGSKKVYMCV